MKNKCKGKVFCIINGERVPWMECAEITIEQHEPCNPIKDFAMQTEVTLKCEMPANAKQVCYNYRVAHEAGVEISAFDQMIKLGFKVLAGVSHTIIDQCWFTVEDYDFELPEYIKPISYNFNYWHGDGILFVW